MEKCVIMVDPYTSSARICDALIDKGIHTMAILTDRVKVPLEVKKVRLPIDKFIKLYSLSDNNFEPFLNEFKQYKILRVISGCELSNDIADHLATVICPETANDLSSSHVRMNKYYMLEVLREANLNSAKQMIVSNNSLPLNSSNILENFNFPVIVKPTASNGTFGVSYCKDLKEIETAINGILGAIHPRYGVQVQDAVIQECLRGDEYFVDTMSYKGHHKIISVQRYHKISYKNVPVYRYCEIIPNETEEAKICIEYIKNVLTATGLSFGFAHTELFLTKDGPVLVEINPRVSGAYGILNKIAKSAYGIDQADALVESIFSPDVFLESTNHIPQKANSYLRNIFIQNWRERIMSNFDNKKLEELPSYKEVIVLKKPGQKIVEAKELGDVVAMVLLEHSDPQQVVLDSDKIFEWEKQEKLF